MKLKLNQLSWALGLSLLLFSCDESGSERPLGEYETGILIMNEGAFGSNDGEVYHLDPVSGTLKPDIFEAANIRPFAGLLEDMVLEGDRLFLVANTGKVEIVNAGDFKSLGAVSNDLDQPRSLAVVGSKLFISDYGPYDANYNTPNSYIAVVDGLNGGSVKKKIKVSNKPEDLFAFGKYVFVAGSEGGKVEIIDAEKESIFKTLEVSGNPKQFFQVDGVLWLYSTGAGEVYFQSFRLDNLTKANLLTLPLANATGRITFDKEGIIYILTSSGWPDYKDAVAKISIVNSTFEPDWITGSGFYGIGFDTKQDLLYVSNAKGFQGNGTVTVYRKNSQVDSEITVGRGPSGFLVY
jgi:DNA-binding beta-propeller fold protein YncE